jgi:hypothetical protein
VDSNLWARIDRWLERYLPVLPVIPVLVACYAVLRMWLGPTEFYPDSPPSLLRHWDRPDTFLTALVIGYGFGIGTVQFMLKNTVDWETLQIRNWSGFHIVMSLAWWVGWMAVAYAILILIWH